jgi:hypothetical protein
MTLSVEGELMLTTYQAMKAYRGAYHITADLKRKLFLLVVQQKELLLQIDQAEADENKAREAMLRVIQSGNETSK